MRVIIDMLDILSFLIVYYTNTRAYDKALRFSFTINFSGIILSSSSIILQYKNRYISFFFSLINAGKFLVQRISHF